MDAGVTPEEFYGLEYQGGFIYSINSATLTCKIINKIEDFFNGDFYFVIGYGVNEASEIPGLGDSGEINTQAILDFFLKKQNTLLLSLLL